MMRWLRNKALLRPAADGDGGGGDGDGGGLFIAIKPCFIAYPVADAYVRDI